MTSGSVSNPFSVRFNNGSGIFGSAQTLMTLSGPSDMDRNGMNDLVIFTLNNVATYFNNGSGVFSLGTNYVLGAGPVGILSDDVNMDGINELITVNNLSKDVVINFWIP